MDLHTIDETLYPTSRDDLAALRDGDGLMSGGTWLMSEPQLHLRRVVDLRAMGWPDLTIDDTGLTIASTCTFRTLIDGVYPSAWLATPIFGRTARAFLASWKIWQNATVGGNLCLGFPAGAMIGMSTVMDARILVWHRDGTDSLLTPTDFVTGNATTVLATGDVVRSILIPDAALRQPTAIAKIALSPLGRSGAVVHGRRTDASTVVAVTAATDRPYRIEVDSTLSPEAAAREVVSQISTTAFYTDAHGAADWRRQVTGVLTRQVIGELNS